MKIKRFHGKNTKEVMHEITDTFGEDAVILNTKRVAGGIEMTAAIEYSDAIRSNQNNINGKVKKISKIIPNEIQAEKYSRKYTHQIDINEQQTYSEVKSELQSLRGLLEHQLSGLAWHDLQTRKPHEAEIIKRLMTLQFEPVLCRNIASHVSRLYADETDFDVIWQGVIGNLVKLIPVCTHSIKHVSGAYVFIGASGTGKTLTVAKVAAQYVLQHGPGAVAIISLNDNKIAGNAELKTYAKILGIPFKPVYEKEDLKITIDTFYDKKLILVDTNSDKNWQKDPDKLIHTISEIIDCNIYLLLAANSQYSNLKNDIKQLEYKKLSGCIVTKLDEAVELGNVLSVLIKHDLPISFYSDGKSVPESLKQAEAKLLVKYAVAEVESKLENYNQEKLALTINGMLTNET